MRGDFPPGNRHVLRLGLRLIAGFREDDAKKLIEARATGGPFLTPADLMRRAKLGPAAMRTLARADAFGSLDLGRRETLWHVAGLEAEDLPLAPQHVIPETPEALSGIVKDMPQRATDDIALPPLRDEEAVTEDYSVFGLSLKKHPMAFVREKLKAKGMATAADLKKLNNGSYVKISGLVLFRQRPGTAKGTIFITIEDETGAANLIVWPKIAIKYRRAVFGAKVLLCEGFLQKESDVIHVVSRRLTDWTCMLKSLQPGQSSAFALRLHQDGKSAQPANVTSPARKSVNSNWTNSLKSRDFR